MQYERPNLLYESLIYVNGRLNQCYMKAKSRLYEMPYVCYMKGHFLLYERPNLCYMKGQIYVL